MGQGLKIQVTHTGRKAEEMGTMAIDGWLFKESTTTIAISFLFLTQHELVSQFFALFDVCAQEIVALLSTQL